MLLEAGHTAKHGFAAVVPQDPSSSIIGGFAGCSRNPARAPLLCLPTLAEVTTGRLPSTLLSNHWVAVKDVKLTCHNMGI